MRVRKRSRRLAALGLCLGLVAAACGGDNDPGPAATGTAGAGNDKTYSVFIVEPNNLVPPNTNESEGSLVLSALFTGLVDYDPQTNIPENAMAENISSTDQINWTIDIKKGWTFHNGEPVLAQSFVDAWNYGAYGPNLAKNAYFYDKIEGYDKTTCKTDEEGTKCVTPATAKTLSGLKVVDEDTFTVKLTAPFSQFPVVLGYTAYYPMPKAAFTDIKKYNEAPIGNGPFKVKSKWEHDVKIELVRNDDYKGTKALSGGVTFKIYKDEKTALIDLQASPPQVDIVDSIPPDNIAAAKRDFGDRFIEQAAASFNYLAFPDYVPALKNPDLRKAFSMAINREELVDKIFLGARAPADSVVSPIVSGYRKGACKYCVFDPAEAKRLFDKAGGFTGTLEIAYNTGSTHDKWTAAVANYWKQNLGIKDSQIKFRAVEFANYTNIADAKGFKGPYRLGWVMDYPSIQNFLEPLYFSGINDFGYSNKKFDDFVTAGNRAATLEEGIKSYQDAEDVLYEDMPIAPIFFGRTTGAYSDRLENVVIDAFQRVRTELVRVK